MKNNHIQTKEEKYWSNILNGQKTKKYIKQINNIFYIIWMKAKEIVMSDN